LPDSTTEQLEDYITDQTVVTEELFYTSPTEGPSNNPTTYLPDSTTEQLDDSNTDQTVVTEEPFNTSSTEGPSNSSTIYLPDSTTEQLNDSNTDLTVTTAEPSNSTPRDVTSSNTFETTTSGSTARSGSTTTRTTDGTTEMTATTTSFASVTTLRTASITASTHLPVTRTTAAPSNSLPTAFPSTSRTTRVSTPINTSSGTTLLSTHQPKTTLAETTLTTTLGLKSTTTKDCQAFSCENSGEFDREFCECVCLPGYSGTFCEVSPSKNPCVMNTRLCSGEGQYCEGDSSSSDGYKCKCRTSDGYVDDKEGGCTLKKAFKSKLHVIGIDGEVEVYKPAYRDPNSAASQALFEVVIEVIKDALRKEKATENFIDVKGVRLDPGSVFVTTVTIFPENDTVDSKGIEAVLKTDSLVNKNSSLSLNKTSLEVTVSTTECQLTCLNGGTCETSGYYPNYGYHCSCNSLFIGESCADVTVLFIVLIVFSGFALLLVMAVLVVCISIQIRRTRRLKSDGSFSGCENPHRRSSSSSGETNHALERDSYLGSQLSLSYSDEMRLSQLTEYMKQSAKTEQEIVPGVPMSYLWGGEIPVRAKSSFTTETSIRLEDYNNGDTQRAYSNNGLNLDS
ncbi:uncharacterized protein, partial [Asterias amurensis]|uniref:uncharacterized protein n=1 Tax=Asterias amurensis TaxID=7602 RepID=UPI003AB27722